MRSVDFFVDVRGMSDIRNEEDRAWPVVNSVLGN